MRDLTPGASPGAATSREIVRRSADLSRHFDVEIRQQNKSIKFWRVPPTLVNVSSVTPAERHRGELAMKISTTAFVPTLPF
jgi:hypothetical protein